MQFEISRPDVVRAISQRWLLKFWKRHRTSNGIPRWQDVEAEDLSRLSANLSFLDVMNNGAEARFQIRYHGPNIAKVYGAADCRGRFLDEVIPVSRHPTGLAPYHRALRTGRPIYTVCEVTDKSGRLVNFERLLLPFSGDGGAIERILASFEFICEDGAFDDSALVKLQSGSPTLRICATIEPPPTV